MKYIKKATITAGAVAGGIIGGAVALAGKLTRANVVEELGDGIVDSAIMTGELVGEALNGTAEIGAGSIKKDGTRRAAGRRELSHAVRTTLGNAVNNIRIVGRSGGEIAGGLAKGDTKRAIHGIRNLGKMAAIGLVTVGVVKMTGDDKRRHGPIETVQDPQGSEKIRDAAAEAQAFGPEDAIADLEKLE